MPDIRVTDIFNFVDAYAKAAGVKMTEELRECAANVVAHDLNKAGVYVEPS
tara:strand:- start:696 stop:848 length:153 start_codon:yes stop_codon:yes gene_type:complete